MWGWGATAPRPHIFAYGRMIAVKQRRAATLLFFVLLAVLAPAVAAAQPSPPPTQPVVNSWALAPTGTDPSQPSSRVYLSYTAAPGSTVHDSVTLWNYSNVQLTFQVYATDALNDTSGGFAALAGDKRPSDVGSWVTLPQSFLTARAHTKLDLPFTLTVPSGVRPGDHVGAILAASQVEGTSPNGKTVTLDRRTGSRIYLRVPGPLTPALTVENMRTVYHPALNPLGGSLDLTYTVRNVGNVRLAAHQSVFAKGPFGLFSKEHKPKDVPELLPGNAITLHEHFTGVPALVRATGEVDLRPFSPDPDVKSVKPVTRGGHTWALPWTIIALLLALWLIRKSYLPIRERRRQLAARSSPPPREPVSPVP